MSMTKDKTSNPPASLKNEGKSISCPWLVLSSIYHNTKKVSDELGQWVACIKLKCRATGNIEVTAVSKHKQGEVYAIGT